MSQPSVEDRPSHDTISIIYPSDFKIIVTRSYSYTKYRTYKQATSNVDHATLLNSTQFFRGWLDRNRFSMKPKNVLELDVSNIVTFEIILRKLHKTLDQMSVGTVSLADIWDLPYLCQTCHVDCEEFTQWFRTWCAHHKGKIEPGRELSYYHEILIPSCVYNDAEIFAQSTRTVVYQNTGHITACIPNEYRKPLAAPLMRELNAARDRLCEIVHQELSGRITHILQRPLSPCCERTVFEFLRELQRIQAWPFDNCFTNLGIDELLNRLAYFDANRMHKYIDPATNSPINCVMCSMDWNTIVDSTATRVAGYFDGLCLDCALRTDENPLPGGQYDKKTTGTA
ncbi:hypothetical protein AtubIFM56815_008593 [Aspergillus tubingensis]|uniref:Uncharacterized protein n=1 Tax=Aspergillus tubingensis TaxID=5068 RepID=A0A9W6ARV4_ASPTU|nr:hypothetical protein AtubIFM54640_007419 [Aspergillus tubingensis]GLA84380.1 hypothetical protein AtubIFM56815_008593 [Aspergillus tubingensis]